MIRRLIGIMYNREWPNRVHPFQCTCAHGRGIPNKRPRKSKHREMVAKKQPWRDVANQGASRRALAIGLLDWRRAYCGAAWWMQSDLRSSSNNPNKMAYAVRERIPSTFAVSAVVTFRSLSLPCVSHECHNPHRQTWMISFTNVN